MARSLSPRHAAERLGITTDTLRRWEREGILRSERTPGGQRRYREETVATLLNDDAPGKSNSNLAHLGAAADKADVNNSVQPHDRIKDVTPWDRRVNEQRAELEVMKLRRERAALIRAEREESEVRQREADERQREGAKQADDAQRRAAEEAASVRRLDALRLYGRSLAILVPANYQAKVVRDLLRTVNGNSFPPDLGDSIAREQVSSRVEHLLKPWHETLSRERVEAHNTRQRAALMASGTSYSSSATRDWDRRDAERARRDVERTLGALVEADWTYDDVRDLVDDVLDEWTDA